MIESNIIKRFIVKTFMQNNDQDLPKIADIVMETLSNRFLLNESVYVVNSNINGKISCTKPVYKISVPDSQEMEVEFESLKRKMPVEHQDVCAFLECITTVTSLGRIVIENVFQKINEPGFGTPGYVEQVKAQPETKLQPFGNRSISLRQKEHIFQSKKQQASDHPVKTKAVEPKPVPKPQSIDLKTMKKITFDGIEDEKMPQLMKIYTFFATFGDFFQIDKFDFEEMVDAIKDPEYSSKVAFLMHKILVDLLEKEIKAHSSKLFSDWDMLFKSLPELEEEASVQQTKRRIPLDLENWKTQVKIFLSNLYKETECDKILNFINFPKKDGFDLRVEFLIFLINLLYYTESLKSMVQTGIESAKAEKQMFDQIASLKRKGGPDAKEELFKCNDKIRQLSKINLRNPARTYIGMYKNYHIYFIDGNIIINHGNEFYLATQKDISIILKDLDTLIKYERLSLINLKDAVATLSVVN